MTDPVASAAPAAAFPPRERAPSLGPTAPAATPPAEPPRQAFPAPPPRQPITVDVARDGDVFIYTLRDPATDTVLAVIPREEVLPDNGRHVDRRV